MADRKFIRKTLSNQPSASEKVTLVRIAEEAGELAHLALKALRFGYTKWNPYEPLLGNNLERMEAEFGDIEHAMAELRASLKPGYANMAASARAKLIPTLSVLPSKDLQDKPTSQEK